VARPCRPRRQRELTLATGAMRPDDLLDRFRIDPTSAGPSGDRHPELLFAAVPGPHEAPDPKRLDPGRATAEPQRSPWIARRHGLALLGLIASLCLHLLPLLALLDWRAAPTEIAPPIPVQLVVEQPPPKPPPQPKPEEPKPPPRGRLSSTDIGEPASQPDQPTAATAATPDEPADTRIAAAPEPMPKPAPMPEPVAVSPPKPKPTPELKRTPRRTVVARLAPNPTPSLRSTHVPGPAATRDEYLAYCMAMIRRYYDMLPAAFIGGRRGQTLLSVVVLDDGTIARINIKQSSGYRDIDSRIEQMVASVRRFPPLPQWIQGQSVTLDYAQSFPEGLLEH
jgi:TonB family protein